MYFLSHFHLSVSLFFVFVFWRNLNCTYRPFFFCKDFDVNMTLAEVVKSKDTRLWEGFPVLLVNSAKDYRFDYLRVMENLTATVEKENFKSLLLLSLALYEQYHVSYFFLYFHKFWNWSCLSNNSIATIACFNPKEVYFILKCRRHRI